MNIFEKLDVALTKFMRAFLTIAGAGFAVFLLWVLYQVFVFHFGK
jgi:hypothetical protein